jgi:hypothetical protein
LNPGGAAAGAWFACCAAAADIATAAISKAPAVTLARIAFSLPLLADSTRLT